MGVYKSIQQSLFAHTNTPVKQTTALNLRTNLSKIAGNEEANQKNRDPRFKPNRLYASLE